MDGGRPHTFDFIGYVKYIPVNQSSIFTGPAEE